MPPLTYSPWGGGGDVTFDRCPLKRGGLPLTDAPGEGVWEVSLLTDSPLGGRGGCYLLQIPPEEGEM